MQLLILQNRVSDNKNGNAFTFLMNLKKKNKFQRMFK